MPDAPLAPFSILSEYGLIVIEDQPELNAQASHAIMDALEYHPHDTTRYHVLVDVSRFTANISPEELDAIIERLRAIQASAQNLKCAIVAQVDRTFAQSRMFQQMADGLIPYKTKVFRSHQEACRWIGVSHTILRKSRS